MSSHLQGWLPHSVLRSAGGVLSLLTLTAFPAPWGVLDAHDVLKLLVREEKNVLRFAKHTGPDEPTGFL